MRKKLLRSYWIGNALTLLIVVVFAAVMLVTDIRTDQGSLMAILNTASAWTTESSSNLQELADKIASSSPPLRVTFIMPNGIILADSGKEDQDPQKLMKQEEVVLALRHGIGEDFSLRDSLLHPSLNAAMLLDGRLILHLSNPIEEIKHLVTVYFPLIVLMFLAMIAVSHWLLDPVTRRVVKQLEQVRDLLEGTTSRDQINPEHFYPELRPAMENILYLIDRLRYDLVQISKTQDMQRDFVDNSSHELKSPLTSITGFAEMLYDEPELGLAQRQEYLGYILEECQRMIAIINDILMLERQDQRKIGEMARVDLNRVANQVAQALSPQAQQKDIAITVQGQCHVFAVEQDMWDLLRNLMGNAVRYGRQGGYVKVLLSEGRLEVRDNGIGIAREHRERIFEKFYRVDAARDRGAGGTGLGLAIAAGITNRYGAAIHVESEPGQGACFIVDFVRKL
ncbi:MAG: hypothetical protein GX171_10405 [Clostridiales bacterium]|jgi:two-component system phosphate regulon sensor histidine kinase PhoR|nr:hypothetical protein [Clostridiales bacterium]